MIKVQKADIDLSKELRRLERKHPEAGAMVSFLGMVREGTGKEKITAMLLEHYPGMTERELERIEQEARRRWDLLDSLIIHRYGKLYPGNNIVLVITVSSHRREAFQAAEFLMDYLKTSAPFWKKEIGAKRTGWVEAKEADQQAARNWLAPKDSDGSDSDSDNNNSDRG